jgi:hypothetical protein
MVSPEIPLVAALVVAVSPPSGSSTGILRDAAGLSVLEGESLSIPESRVKEGNSG